jgi:hypothetical protein
MRVYSCDSAYSLNHVFSNRKETFAQGYNLNKPVRVELYEHAAFWMADAA